MRFIFNKMKAILSLFLLIAAVDAHAASIVNLDTIPYDLDVEIAGRKQTVSIEPNARWDSNMHPIRVNIGKRVTTLDPDMEYAIWKGGVLTPQRQLKQNDKH